MENKHLQDLYKGVIEQLGEDPNREGLLKTPERVAKAMHGLGVPSAAELKALHARVAALEAQLGAKPKAAAKPAAKVAAKKAPAKKAVKK